MGNLTGQIKLALQSLILSVGKLSLVILVVYHENGSEIKTVSKNERMILFFRLEDWKEELELG